MKRTVLVQRKFENGDKAPEKLRLNPVYITGVATQLKDDDISKVNTLVEVIYDLLKIYGYGDKRKFSSTPDMEREHCETTARNKLKLVERFNQFVKKAGYGSWKDLFKYKINAFFSFHNGQEIPPMPQGLDEFPDLADPGFLAYGRAKRFIGILKLETQKFRSFALSLALGGKKGAPPVHDDTIAAAEDKTFQHLTSEHPDIPDFEITDKEGFVFPINRETTCYQLRRTVREIWGSHMTKKGLKKPSVKRSDLVKPCSPSWSAQYHFSRDQKGAVGSFLNLESVQRATGQSFVDMNLERVFLSGKLSEVYGPAGLIDQQKIDEEENENLFFKETLGVGYDVTRLNELWDKEIYPNLLEQAMVEPPNTVVIGLAEPLKVRNITAGPPITYTALKPMQKWLWKSLRKNSVFQLIGTPVTEDIVAKQLGVLGEDEEFISGDYKASTDNLHSWVSETLLDELFIILRENNEDEDEGGTPSEWLDMLEVLMKRALTGHRILDPKRMMWYRKGVENLPASWFKDQKEGQLMGSVISFPFLCMANAALCRWAMEISSGKNFKIVDRPISGYELAPLLVNGDDCVKKGKVGVLFPNWKQVTAFGGLESSVGKTFNAKEFLQINSEQFEYQVPGWELVSGMTPEAIYKKLKYVNLGLVYAQKKDGRRGKCFAQLGSLHRDLERTCPAELFVKASTKFVKEAMKVRYAAKTKKIYSDPDTGKILIFPKVVNVFKDGMLCVSRIPFSSLRDAEIPYFLPSWLGGLGLVPFKEEHVSNYERVVGSFLRSNMGYSQDFTLRPFKERAKCQTHQLVADSLQDFKFLDGQSHQYVSLDDSGQAVRNLQDQYETLYGALCIDQLLKNPDKLIEVISRKEIYEDFFDNCFQIRKVLRRARNALKDPVVYARHHATRLTDEELKSEKKQFNLSCYNRTPVKGALKAI